MHFFEITSGGRAINGSGYGRPSDHVDPQTTNNKHDKTDNIQQQHNEQQNKNKGSSNNKEQ